jgi:hypothetical protein
LTQRGLADRASKTRYLQQARNAKAMADALSYTSEPLKPKQAAMDAAMAYKAAKEAKAPEAATAPAAISSPQAVTPGRPKKERIKFDIVSAEPEMTEELTKVVNWAYRGKEGQQVRTHARLAPERYHSSALPPERCHRLPLSQAATVAAWTASTLKALVDYP